MAVLPASRRITAAELDHLKEELANSLNIQDILSAERWPNPCYHPSHLLRENKLAIRNILGRF